PTTSSSFCSQLPPPPPTSTLFPYTTLFRSDQIGRRPRRFGKNPEAYLSRLLNKPLPRIGLLFTILTAETQRAPRGGGGRGAAGKDRKSTRLNSSHVSISYAVFCLKKKSQTS